MQHSLLGACLLPQERHAPGGGCSSSPDPERKRHGGWTCRWSTTLSRPTACTRLTPMLLGGSQWAPSSPGPGSPQGLPGPAASGNSHDQGDFHVIRIPVSSCYPRTSSHFHGTGFPKGTPQIQAQTHTPSVVLKPQGDFNEPQHPAHSGSAWLP